MKKTLMLSVALLIGVQSAQPLVASTKSTLEQMREISDTCDFWMDEAWRTNSFAAKQEIIHNLYAYLDEVNIEGKAEEINTIRAKLDNSVKKVAEHFNVSIDGLKVVPDWVVNWDKTHTNTENEAH